MRKGTAHRGTGSAATAEAALRASEERLRLALRAGRMGTWDWDLATDAVVWSEGHYTLLGYRVAEVQPSYEAFRDRMHPEDLARQERAITAARSGRQEYICEFRVVWPDGSVHWVEARGQFVYDRRGAAIRMFGVISDIDSDKQAERAMAAQTELLAGILDNIPVMLCIWDPTLQRFRFNRHLQEVLGWTESDGGPDFMAKVYPDPRYREMVSEYMQSLAGGWRDLETRTKDGRTVDCSWANVRLSDDTGIGIGIDISARKALERERDRLLEAERAARGVAEHASRLKDEFLASLSHELRTPLGVILGWARLLRKGGLSAAEVDEAHRIIESSAQLQKQLIDDLLDVSRIISGKLLLERRPEEIAVLAHDALASIRPAVEAKALELVERIQPDAGSVLGDAGRLQQVVWNLLTNAVKFTPRGGKITVTVERAGERVRVTVSDTGVGIRREFLDQLFDRFRQQDAATTRRFRGLGLGLSIVKQLVTMHGGTITAASDGDDRGATFTVELPRLDDTILRRADAAAAAAIDESLAGLTVLVVEDEPATLDLVERVLTEAGAEVVTAETAAAALDRLAERRPDVLVSDISMPDEDGYLLLRRVRALADPSLARIPALALTALARDEDRERALRCGYAAHLAKPAEPAALIAAVARLRDAADGPEAPPCNGPLRVLVVEDSLQLALALCQELEDAGCETVGPVGRLDRALALVRSEPCDAALLDVDLDGEKVWPLARTLRQRGTPYALVTGFELDQVPPDLRDGVVMSKPVAVKELQDWLMACRRHR